MDNASMDNTKFGYIIVENDSGTPVPADEKGDYYHPYIYLDENKAVEALKSLYSSVLNRMRELYIGEEVFDYITISTEEPWRSNFEVYCVDETYTGDIKRFDIID